jgi:cytochrome b
MNMMGHLSVRVWDPLVRGFHWTLVIALTLCYWSRMTDYELHRLTGYVVLGLILVRILWGFVGTRHAHFSDFLVGPRRLAGYLAALMRGHAPRFLGHNPAGGYMVLALLTTLLVLCVSGVMLDAAENRAGPLAGYRLFLYTDIIQSVHVRATDLGLVLVLLHLAGVLHATVMHRENLVRAMVTGRKRT